MTLNVLLILIVLMLAAAWLRWRRCSRVLTALAVIAFLAVGCGPVPIALMTRLQSAYAMPVPLAWGQRNVIVLLGAGDARVVGSDRVEPNLFAYGRINRAVDLYRDCREGAQRLCRIQVSGGDAQHLGRPEAQVYYENLLRLGVAPEDLIIESRSMNTWQNAQFSAPLLKAWRADRILLVSSGYHLRRGALYFRHFGIDATPVRADYINGLHSWLPLSYNFTVADLALHEYVGVLRYHVYNAMGWNVRATKAGAL